MWTVYHWNIGVSWCVLWLVHHCMWQAFPSFYTASDKSCVKGLGMRLYQIQCNSNVASFPASCQGGAWEWGSQPHAREEPGNEANTKLHVRTCITKAADVHSMWQQTYNGGTSWFSTYVHLELSWGRRQLTWSSELPLASCSIYDNTELILS